MERFDIAVKIDKLNDELDKAVGILMQIPFTYDTVKRAREKVADVLVELSKLVDELNREE